MRGVALALAGLVASALAGDAFPIKVYPCPRFTRPPKIDGRLDDPCWQAAPVASGFTHYRKPRLMEVQTAFRLGYDQQFLYLGVHCDEPQAKKLVPSFAGRDSSGCFRGETIEFFLDPTHSHKDYYQFAVNLAGSFFDAFKFERHWNSTTRLKTAVVGGGWELEMAIPWREVGVATPKAGMVMGFNVCRDRYAGGAREWSNWAQTMANFHDVARFGHLVLSPRPGELARLAPEFRKGERSGPIVIYAKGGQAGKTYRAMADDAMGAIERQLDELVALARKESNKKTTEEILRRVGQVRARLAQYRKRLEGRKTLDGATWTRMGVELTQVSRELKETLWDARLAALLNEL